MPTLNRVEQVREVLVILAESSSPTGPHHTHRVIWSIVRWPLRSSPLQPHFWPCTDTRPGPSPACPGSSRFRLPVDWDACRPSCSEHCWQKRLSCLRTHPSHIENKTTKISYFCHHLRRLTSVQTCITFSLQWNTKEGKLQCPDGQTLKLQKSTIQVVHASLAAAFKVFWNSVTGSVYTWYEDAFMSIWSQVGDAKH